ncbi:hypothetical protein K437DRAFT_185763 [Tilletiaria anomala UBC 951]|uniref:DUF3752 domain-containing protein n=1 Tax=Tilletiaria anomala (strain ATCC 24038 / CBS 436.72 / UBC 951) TaxID=1037660 RepID=A0A066WND2_TILAU|nr:uncharacterized protein K437DRAFT_185763 [Tilletiaria anomala UBC 951]KDN52504.1 hypothetical protein K437DRAFT_185763 [Tilletiaria anomala UBC 951]
MLQLPKRTSVQDLVGDPLKLKSRGFSQNNRVQARSGISSATGPAQDSNLWTETPQQRTERLHREAQGSVQGAQPTLGVEASWEVKLRNSREHQRAEAIERDPSRSQTLLEIHRQKRRDEYSSQNRERQRDRSHRHSSSSSRDRDKRRVHDSNKDEQPDREKRLTKDSSHREKRGREDESDVSGKLGHEAGDEARRHKRKHRSRKDPIGDDDGEERSRKRSSRRCSKAIDYSSRKDETVSSHDRPGSSSATTVGSWDWEKAMSIGGRLVDERARKKTIQQAAGLSDRFGRGSSSFL